MWECAGWISYVGCEGGYLMWGCAGWISYVGVCGVDILCGGVRGGYLM